MGKHLLLLIFVLSTFGQTSPVTIAGVELRLGMTKDSVLSKFVTAGPELKVHEIHADWYSVTAKTTDSWVSAGNLTFHDGRLTRIALDAYSSGDAGAIGLVKAAYTTITVGQPQGLIDVWTGRNEDASNPMYEIHLVFKDREVVINTLSSQNVDSASVTTYFPRVRRVGKSK
jgi:hypothetical protein